MEENPQILRKGHFSNLSSPSSVIAVPTAITPDTYFALTPLPIEYDATPSRPFGHHDHLIKFSTHAFQFVVHAHGEAVPKNRIT